MFKKVKPSELQNNLFKMISKDWGVITVSGEDKVNGMTASWIQMGYIWNKDVVTVYVRPQRYTDELMRKEETFSVAFFDEEYREQVNYLGRISGKDEDKLKKCDFTTTIVEDTAVIEQASVVFVCKKLYQGILKKENFLDQELAKKCYPGEDFHHAYVAEIKEVLVKE